MRITFKIDFLQSWKELGELFWDPAGYPMMSARGYNNAILEGKGTSPYRWSPPFSQVGSVKGKFLPRQKRRIGYDIKLKTNCV